MTDWTKVLALHLMEQEEKMDMSDPSVQQMLDDDRAEALARIRAATTTSEITLRITTAANSIPSEWDWTTLLDLGGDEAVEVVGYGTNVDNNKGE